MKKVLVSVAVLWFASNVYAGSPAPKPATPQEQYLKALYEQKKFAPGSAPIEWADYARQNGHPQNAHDPYDTKINSPSSITEYKATKFLNADVPGEAPISRGDYERYTLSKDATFSNIEAGGYENLLPDGRGKAIAREQGQPAPNFRNGGQTPEPSWSAGYQPVQQYPGNDRPITTGGPIAGSLASAGFHPVTGNDGKPVAVGPKGELNFGYGHNAWVTPDMMEAAEKQRKHDYYESVRQEVLEYRAINGIGASDPAALEKEIQEWIQLGLGDDSKRVLKQDGVKIKSYYPNGEKP